MESQPFLELHNPPVNTYSLYSLQQVFPFILHVCFIYLFICLWKELYKHCETESSICWFTLQMVVMASIEPSRGQELHPGLLCRWQGLGQKYFSKAITGSCRSGAASTRISTHMGHGVVRSSFIHYSIMLAPPISILVL